jgi:hypothetical protein
MHAAVPHPGDGISELTVCAFVAYCLGDALDAGDEFGDRVVEACRNGTVIVLG